MSDPLLAQYAVLSQRGMHFGRLYWQSIAFHVVMLLASAAVFRDLTGVWLGAALILAGLATLLMAFVVSRLWIQEGKYELLLANIETALRAQGLTDIQTSPAADRHGARYVMNIAIAMLGGVLGVSGVTVLVMQAGQSAG